MERYFYEKDGAQQGPFTLAELKEQGIRPNTRVWHFGLIQWTEARKLKELEGFFQTVVPETLPSDPDLLDTFQSEETASTVYPSSRLVAAAVLGCFFLGVFGIVAAVYTYQSRQHFLQGNYAQAQSSEQTAWKILKISGIAIGLSAILFFAVAVFYASGHHR